MGTRGVVPAANSLVTAEKEGGERGVVGRPLPTKRGNPSGIGYTRAATRFQVINNPCLYQGNRHLLGIPGH